MNILSIGNSFSVNAHHYLHKIARLDEKQPIFCWNLYIGGCSLATHYRNNHLDASAYDLYVNGMNTELKISIKKALLAIHNGTWDIVTIQQASMSSFKYETYQPYLSDLIATVREYCPKAKIYVHQTWAYEPNSDRLALTGFEKDTDMFREIAGCYDKAAKEINADAIIPAGCAMQAMLKMGIEKVHCDGFHANSIGKLGIALTWYQVLTGRSVKNLDFSHFDFDGIPTEEEIEIAKRASYEAAKKYGFDIKSAL